MRVEFEYYLYTNFDKLVTPGVLFSTGTLILTIGSVFCLRMIPDKMYFTCNPYIYHTMGKQLIAYEVSIFSPVNEC